MKHVLSTPETLTKFRTALMGGVAGLGLLIAGAAYAQQGPTGAEVPKQLGQQATAALEDDPVILSAPEPDARRIYVTDPAHFGVSTQTFTVDGNNGKVLSITDGGFLANPFAATDGSFFGLASTVYSRVSHGKRDDYIEVIDAKTHDVIADIDIPESRFLVGTYPWMTTVTPDNKSLLFYQFTPSPQVGLVDIENKKFVRMLDVPDCYHIFPQAPDTFFMHCRNGSMAKVTFDKDGKVDVKHSEVFHPEDDYLINTPAFSMKQGLIAWPTYEGKIYLVDVSSGEAKFGKHFEVFTPEEKAEGWAPGGWLPVAYHRDRGEVYLLADKRKKWTHKFSSQFVFVHDVKTGKRLRKIELGRDIDSVAVSQDDKPQLYTLSTGEKALYILDAETGKELNKVAELGHGPQVIISHDN